MRRLASGLVLLLVVAGCTSAGAPPISSTGVVTLPGLLPRTDLLDVDFGQEPLDPRSGFELWTGELVVLGLDEPVNRRFVLTTEQAGPHLPPPPSPDWQSVDIEGREGQLAPSGGNPGCGHRTLTVQATPDLRFRVSGVTEQSADALRAIAADVTVRAGRLELARNVLAAGVDRLPDRWLVGGGGSRLVTGLRPFLVRRADEREQRLLLAVRCPDPLHQLSPPDSTDQAKLARFEPRRIHLAGRTIDTGAIGQSQIAVVRGKAGLVALGSIGCCELRPVGELVGLVAHAAAVPARRLTDLDAEARQRIVGEQRRSFDRQLARDGGTAVGEGHDGDLAWVLARRQQRYVDGRVEPELCFTALRQLNGQPGAMYTDECVSESATGPLVLAPPYPTPIVDHLWGAVRDDVAVVEISGPGRTTRRVRPIAITGSPIRRTVVAALDPPAVTDGLVHGDLLRREFVLRGGPVIVRALATDGRELSAVAVGKAGCPIPPGCAP